MNKSAFETAMGMRGYAGSNAEREDRKENKPTRTITELFDAEGKRLNDCDYRIREDDRGLYVRRLGMIGRIETTETEIETAKFLHRIIRHQITHYELLTD